MVRIPLKIQKFTILLSKIVKNLGTSNYICLGKLAAGSLCNKFILIFLPNIRMSKTNFIVLKVTKMKMGIAKHHENIAKKRDNF